MKKFLFKVLVPTIAILVLLLGCVELYLRSLPNDFKSKAEYMKEHASEIKVLVIGSSCTAMGVKPSCFNSQPAFSLAYANQSFNYSYLILKNYIEDLDSLQYLIMDATYAGLWDRGDFAQTFVKKYSIYYGLNDFKGFENNYEISANVKDIFKRLVHYSDRDAFTTCDPDGFQSHYFEDLPYDDKQWKEYGEFHCKGEHTLIYRDNAQHYYESNTSILKQIVELCRDKSVWVLFVSTPCHPYYYNFYDEKQIHIVDSTYSSLCRDYDNVKWLDYTTMDFGNEEMSNVNHLNTRGAIRFTQVINDSILRWNIIEN